MSLERGMSALLELEVRSCERSGDIDGVDDGRLIEAVLVPVIRKRMHDAIALASRFPRPGITGSGRGIPGTAGVTGE